MKTHDMQSFFVGVKGVFVKDGKVLLLKRIDRKGSPFWDMPGGRIHENEEIEAALHRELKEEIGVENVRIDKLLTAFNLTGYRREGNGLVILYYLVFAEHFEITLSDEHVGFEWVSLDELLAKLENGEQVNEGIQMAVSLAVM